MVTSILFLGGGHRVKVMGTYLLGTGVRDKRLVGIEMGAQHKMELLYLKQSPSMLTKTHAVDLS